MSNKYDPASLSDDEDGSITSRSTWASTSDATILGFADGFVGQGGAELQDWRTNRLGGEPSFPPMSQKPPVESSECKLCRNKMPLIMQIYCPLESSMNERVMYTFACPRKQCRGKEGSVRVWRANVSFPPEEDEEPQQEPAPAEKPAVALGSLIFGAPASGSSGANPFASAVPAKTNVDEVASSLQKTKLDEEKPSHTWQSPPAFPAQYLTTAYEPPSPPRKSVPLPVTEEEFDDDPKHREGKAAGGRTKKAQGSGGDQWGKEAYEVQKVKGVDEVFLHFQERVSREGKQVVRYDHSAVPLPFSEQSDAFGKIFKRQSEDSVPQYDPSKLPACSCGMPRCFELQIMPHAVTLLNKSAELPQSTAFAKNPKTAADATKDKSKLLDQDGLDFATAMVFACVGECLDAAGEAWKEELVLVELE